MATKYLTKAITLPSGKRKYIRGKTKEELEQKVLEARLLLGAGIDISDATTFGEFASLWYNTYKKPNLRFKSQEAVKNALNNHILPYLTAYPMRDITPMHIHHVMAQLTNKSRTLNNQVLQAMKGVFNAAMDNSLIVKSPVPVTMRAGGKVTEEKTILSKQESEELLMELKGKRVYNLVSLLLRTGLRRGEALALTWDNVDLDNRMIYVRKNLVDHSWEMFISNELKPPASRRDIPIPDSLYAQLRQMKSKATAIYLFTNADGSGPIKKTSFRAMWEVVNATSHPVTPHQLRHTYITRLFEGGLDLKQVQYLAGHSTPDMTLRVYTHYLKASRQSETTASVKRAIK